MQGWTIVLVAIAYLCFLFVVASFGDRQTRPQKSRPAIYALSLAIYCTSWTFFGSVGLASTSGLDFLAIYVGPVLMITAGYPLLSHMIAVAKRERITSIADFIASRYGKSTAAGAVASVIAVLGTVPYIALQLKAISTSVDNMVTQYQPSVLAAAGVPIDTSFFVSVLLALFAILFGTRHADATEHQRGLILAVATESIVKLVAFLAVGLFVTFYLFDGLGDLVAKAQANTYVATTFYTGINPGNFAIFTLLSFCAFVLLPRQFHVGVVENHSLQELRTARWMFPLYLVLINLFVIPVALAGMLTFGSAIDADSYVLALPLDSGVQSLSMLVFIGGLSAATAMVIVACVALAIMISNNLVLPLLLRRDASARARHGHGNMAARLLNIRRTAIFIILALAYAYFQVAGDSAALASIGLLSFAAVAQFAPAVFIGLFWSRATAPGALFGMGAGFATWIYTLFLPTIVDPASSLLVEGPLGLDWLRPQALFGMDAPPLAHGVIFSLLVNTLVYCLVSLMREPLAIERMQAGVFRIIGRRPGNAPSREGRAVTLAELKFSVSNYLGRERCDRAFDAFFADRTKMPGSRDLVDDDVIQFAEQLLASAIGAASSRLVMSLLLRKHEGEAETTIQLLDDASEALLYHRDLLQTALDQVEQGICVFDPEFRLSSWNSQFRALLDLPASMGQVGTPLPTIAEAIQAQLKAGESEPDLIRCLLDLGNPFSITLANGGRIIEVYTKAVPDGGLVITWSDTTERANAARVLQIANETLERRVHERTEELTRLNADLAKAREAAEAANIGKTKFLAAVGHDILQPLNAARLYTSSLVERLDADPARALAGNVDDALESVEDILGAVLAISRLDSGVLTPNVTVFAVDRLFARLKNEFLPSAAAKGLTLQVQSNSFHVRSDYSLLRRLLQNLISNAIKYTERGTVTLDAKVERNRLVFEVRDTGSGIAAEDREAIFEEFLRLDAGKRAAPGLGLGLSIVRRLADTLGHEIELETEPGAGCTFFVKVPLVVPEQPEVGDALPDKFAGSGFKGMVVICIDNEPRILEGMKTLLEGWGCEVHPFADSQSILQDAPELEPDAVLADYHLDRETGLDAIEILRSKLGKRFVAALITADRSAAVRKLAEAADVRLLNKPLKPAALRALFAKTLISARKSKADKSIDAIPAE